MTGIHDLRERVTLLKRRVEEDGEGTFTETWRDLDTVWAHVRPCSAPEREGEGWNTLTPVRARYKVTIRWRKGRFDRVKWGIRFWDSCVLPYQMNAVNG